MKKLCAAVAALGAFCAWADGDGFDPSADIDTTGGYTISEPGEVTLTGVISGNGVLTYTGQGTLILTKPSPNFTGGIDVSWGEVQANVEGALGSGKITVYGGRATLVLNASGATFANDIENNGGDSATGGETYRVTIRVLESVTLTGRITSPNNKLFSIWNKNYDMSLTRPTTVYEGTVDIGTGMLYLGAYGHHNFRKALTCGTLDANSFHSARGFVELWSPDNRISNGINHETFNIDCKAAHVLGGGYLKGCTGSANVDSQSDPRGQVYLNGFDQTVSYLDMGANILSDAGTKYHIHATDKANSNPETEATLFLTGTGDHTTGYGLVNKVNLVVDGAGLNQAFSTKEQFATGALIASNGTITVSDNVKFDKVTRLVAAPDGTIAATATAADGVFAGVTRLDIEGALSLAEGFEQPFSPSEVDVRLGRSASADFGGYSLLAKSLAIEDENGVYQPMGGGTYAQPPVTGGEIFIPGGSEATWTGGGEGDRSVNAAANWGGTKPDLTHGSVAATFAEGGDFAAVDRALKFAGVTLRSPSDEVAGFSFAKANEAASFTLLDGGLKTVDADTSVPVSYAFDLPVATAGNQLWAVQTNATVALSNGLSVAAGTRLTNTGAGRIEFLGESTLAGAFSSTNGDILVSGIVATPGHVDQGAASQNGAKTFTVLLNQYVNPSANPKVWNGTWPRLFLDNAVFECPVCIGGRSKDDAPGCRDFLVQTPGSTNVFKGDVTFPSPVGYVFQSKDESSRATMVFEGGVNFNGGTHFSYGTVIVRNKPISGSANRMVIELGGELILEVAGNLFVPQPNNGRIECRVDGALPSSGAALLNGMTVIELNGTKQMMGEFSNNSVNTRIHGDAGSEIALRKGTFTGQFTGGVSLVKYGTDTVTLTSSASPSTGDLTVTNGVLEIAANASWLNGTNVTVAGAGTLKLGSADALNRRAVMHLGAKGDAWLLDIPSGQRLSVRTAFDADGNELEPGVYGPAGVPGVNHPEYAAHFPAGGGVLNVRGGGLVLFVR